jgi:UDP-glucose 4-epimerase
MSQERIVLVTGVASPWGSRVAQKLLTEADCRAAGRVACSVIGLDAEPPVEEVPGLDFVRADIRNPLLVDLLKANEVDTVCHLAFAGTRRRSEAAFDLNVMGTAKLMSACAAAGVRKVVLKSSMAVYGARATNSAFLREDHALRGSRRYGYVRDMVEVESFCSDFRRREPGVLLTILRFPSIIGPTVKTRMTRFLKESWAPSLLGFDPMMQIIHEEDVVNALVHAVLKDLPGVYNVAADDVLPLSKIRGLAGKSPLPVFHKLAYWGVALPGGTSRFLDRCLPIEPDYIRFPWVGDLSKMRGEFGFEPSHTAEEALREFAQRTNLERRQSRTTGAPLAQGPQQSATVQPPVGPEAGEGVSGGQ